MVNFDNLYNKEIHFFVFHWANFHNETEVYVSYYQFKVLLRVFMLEMRMHLFHFYIIRVHLLKDLCGWFYLIL